MYSNDVLGSFGSFDRYGVEDKWDKLQKDISENMEDPFMFKEFFRNIKAAWSRYWQFREEFDRDVTALIAIDSTWSKG